MVGSTRHAASVSRDVYNNRQQAEFIRQLRLLYQRSLRTRAAARLTDPHSTHMPIVTNPAHMMPPGWGSTAAATTAAGPETAAGAGTDAEDPCPAGQQLTAQVVPTTAAAAAQPLPQLQQQQHQASQEDSDDEPLAVVSEQSDDEEEYEEEESEEMEELLDCESEDAADQDMEDPAQNRNLHSTTATAAPATRAIQNAWDTASRRAAAVAAGPTAAWQQQPQSGFTAVPLLPPDTWRRPAACSFLQRGVAFEGCQQLTTQMLDVQRRSERWTVSVTIQDVDLATGYVSGTMLARDIPDVSHPIETFWQGCIIDDVNQTFYTRAWGASKETDLQHWAKFEQWSDIESAVKQHSGRCGQLEQHPVIYMRWKEQFFVQPQQRGCGLTIAGFYYVALNRLTGQLQGYYYDPQSSPYQELQLSVCRGSSSESSNSSSSSSRTANRSSSTVPPAAGVSFANYSFA